MNDFIKKTVKIDKVIIYWLKIADYDIDTAKSLIRSKKYIYTLFFCHLAIEKYLKALVSKVTNSHAPYTHNLLKLAELSQSDFSKDILEFFAEVNVLNIEARYPEYKLNIYNIATNQFTRLVLKKTEEIIKCLKEMIIKK